MFVIQQNESLLEGEVCSLGEACDAARAYFYVLYRSTLSLSRCELLGSIKCCTAPFALGGTQVLGFTPQHHWLSCQKVASLEHKAFSIYPCELLWPPYIFVPVAICKPHYCALEKISLFIILCMQDKTEWPCMYQGFSVILVGNPNICNLKISGQILTKN